MEIYIQKKASNEQKVKQLQKQYNQISFGRLLTVVVMLVALYYYQKTNNASLLYIGASAFVGFFVLMRWHTRVAYQKKLSQAIVDCNADEIAFLERKSIPFENGAEYNDFQHPYAYDLDIFGPNSLFQSLNRTGTFMGKKRLAAHLLANTKADEIPHIQAAIKELREKLDWRQAFLATARVGQDNKSSYTRLLQWCSFNTKAVSKITTVLSYVLPIVLVGFVMGYLLTFNPIWLKYFAFLFVVNLVLAGSYVKRIMAENAHSSEINTMLDNYSQLFLKIENEDFSASKCKQLQQVLSVDGLPVSAKIKALSSIFSKLDSTNNLVVSVLFNGLFLFNIHILNACLLWKKEHAKNLECDLDVIGEFEMLNSLANFSFNNPDFAFPELNEEYKIAFESLSHPLLNPKNRVGNTVAFQPQSFIILTGSNMSGKSTFLRSLGVNMVLAGMGAPVCATQANVHPMSVLVSMRLSDSLSDSESYFFAEIKRLKQIMDGLDESPAFVLLDEILRGTNSDDKRSGTIEVVKKVIAKKAIGAIATHDIEVCLTTNEFPQVLTNKCFEVEIKNDELHFDYQLREGICQNKSATFLMKKMGVI